MTIFAEEHRPLTAPVRFENVVEECGLSGGPGVDCNANDVLDGCELLLQQAKVVQSDEETNDNFGAAVDVAGDYAVVGVGAENAGFGIGSAHVFKREGSDWDKIATLTPSDAPQFAGFGRSLDICGDTIVVGAAGHFRGNFSDAAYIFRRPENGWMDMTETAKLTSTDVQDGDEFGSSVAMDGNTIVVGASWHYVGSVSRAGAAFVYLWNGTTWEQEAMLTASVPIPNNFLGRSVALSQDMIVVGASGTWGSVGSAYVFRRPDTGWMDMTETSRLTSAETEEGDFFGNSVAIHEDTIVVGAPLEDDTGAVYIYRSNGAAWGQQARLTRSIGLDRFGSDVALEGETLIVGAPTNGGPFAVPSAYVYRWDGASWGAVGHVSPPEVTRDDGFGRHIAIEGNTVAIGAPGVSNGRRGAVYIYADQDCNRNGILDECDVAEEDCNGNEVPDDCEDDADRDGVPDACDLCPDSSPGDNLILSGCDTGAADMLVRDGCTMGQVIDACRTGANRHGDYIVCVEEAARRWRSDRIITGRQFGGIVSCAARAVDENGRPRHSGRGR
jgi:hypothetical protein